MTKSRTRLYHIWNAMNSRCHSPFNKSFRAYGAKGILVCADWRFSFENFQQWAMLNGYEPGLSLDRIKNDKGYSPENCRWASRAGQQQNRQKSSVVASSRFKGVSWSQRRKHWRVEIVHNGTYRYGGAFTDEQEAARKYDDLATKLHGIFAVLNFPHEPLSLTIR